MKSLDTKPSLENLIESQDFGLEILHPGGLEVTKELAELCHVGRNSKVLDVASGTGQSACYLAEHISCQIMGVDASDYMVERARKKARGKIWMSNLKRQMPTIYPLMITLLIL